MDEKNPVVCPCGGTHSFLTHEDWEYHYRDIGLCNFCIAFNYQRSIQRVHQVRYNGDPLLDARDMAVRKLLPFKLGRKFHQGGLPHNLLTHGEWMYLTSVTDPKRSDYYWKGNLETIENKVARLIAFHARLRTTGTIIKFDPSIPPNEHSKNGGWDLVDRQESDEDFIVRIPADSELTENERSIWRLPPFKKGLKPVVDAARIKRPNVCGHPDR